MNKNLSFGAWLKLNLFEAKGSIVKLIKNCKGM
jgi:hypothetical protein